MTRIRPIRERIQSAEGLASMLDAAHDAFEDMISVVRAHEDPADGMFIPLVMAAGSAAEGRNAIIFAPSLPPRRLHSATRAEEPRGAAAETVTTELATLSELLATRLTEAARFAPDRADQTACRDAARSARDIHALLTGSGP